MIIVVLLKHLGLKEAEVNYTNEDRQQKTVRIAIIGLIVLFIGIIAFTINHFVYIAMYPVEVRILIAPKDAKLTINNKQYNTSGTARFKEGDYTIKVEKSEFISLEKTVTFKKGEDNRIYEYLEREDGNKTWFESDRENQTRFESVSEFKAREIQNNYAEDKIFLITPKDNYVDGYKISAAKDEEGKITINIYLYACGKTPQLDQFKNNAIKYLTDNNINLEDYKVNYSNC